MKRLIALAVAALAGCPSSSTTPAPTGPQPPAPAAELRHPDEVHFGEIRQLSRDARENAEAYWSFDNRRLIFQSNRPPYECDQIYSMAADGSDEPTLISTGKGRTTCAYYEPGGERVVWSSTHLDSDACPPAPDHSQGYVWAIYGGYDVFASKPDGSEVVRLTDSPGYDAEATICAKDGSIVFTSTRDGDLDLYRMDADGGNVVRLTNTPGYDGGAFFDANCEKIVWRASRPTGDALADYQRLLGMGLVRPSKLELYVANADGSDPHQVTYLDAASFGPFFYPSGERIIFSSNYGSADGREFDLWAINVDGTELERITHREGFDGFPMFSHDGQWLVFGSNRNQANPRETDIYVARWIEGERAVAAPSPADRYMADVRWLADDAREGRGIGTPGLAAATEWLAQQLDALGLEPRKQAFDAVVSVTNGAATALAIDGKPVAAADFVPASASSDGKLSARTVFAGYGITAPDFGLDDYKGVKAKGKIVVVRRFAPKEGGLADDEQQRRYGDLHYKARNAREHGAIGLIVVDLPAGKALPEEAPLPSLRVERHGDAGLPVVLVKRALGEKLLRGRHTAAINVQLERSKAPTHNVIGVLKAGVADPLPGAVVLGAHFDHLGLGGEGSLATAVGGSEVPEVHNGADDNASGTAALLEAARLLRERQGELRRDVWFVAFSAEESGLLGSTLFTREPPEGLAVGDVVAMVNMDMVGRLRRNTLDIIGGDSAAEWGELVDSACAEQRVRCTVGGDGYGPSDQTPFYAAGVPVLHIFTGAHDDYHKPSDDASTINAAGGARVAAVVADVARAVANREARLTYKSAEAPAPRGDVRSYGASLGTIPDYAAADDGSKGVLLSGVRKGGAAEVAGVRRGDRIVKIGDKDIENIRDMMFVLREAKPGEQTTVTVERDGKRVELRVTYGKSRRRR